MFGYVVWLLLALLVFWAIGAYNRLMRLRGAIAKAFAALDEHLTRRAAICDQLCELMRPLLPTEQSTFDTLAAAQSEAQLLAAQVRAKPYAADPVASLAVAAAVHAAALTRLKSLLEHHAELREHAELYGLQDELKMVERQRDFNRQVFNQAVKQYNEAVREFPTRLLTGFYGFTEARSL
ncbi:LemA family protein [Pelomonas sp. SE-A7]|uniref:LemA family protein n=1 Tax=Pelomonas sp. SE-A7 TaxID=3054953 RepID=UPI00259CDB27|nr:LemA family protein [Pelomonas sp. SE-A7]MDM4766886.1 LemA family protein [Pelomonas sp. SE-A7]